MEATIKKIIGSFSMRVIFLALFLFNASISYGQAGETVVIVNKKNTITSLSLKDLKMLFKGQQKEWRNGLPVTLFLPSIRSKTMQVFSQKVFGQSGISGVQNYYLRAIYQQKMTSFPRVSEHPVLDISSTAGGITLVDSELLNDVEGIKIIKVEGL